MQYTLDGCPMPETILLASGGIRGLSYVGALEELERRGGLAAVKTWAGVSAGALTATALAIGYTIQEMHDISVRFNFGVLKNIDETSPLRLFEHYGLDNGERQRRFFAAIFHVKGLSDSYKFKDLPAERDLKIWATNLSKGRLECFSRATTPDVEVAFALQASATIPVVYDPLRLGCGDILIDGAVISAFPLTSLKPEERVKTLGFVCTCSLTDSHPEDFTDYLKKFIRLGFEYRSNSVIEIFRDQIVSIDTTDIDAINFDMTGAEKEVLIKRGEASMKRYLKELKARQMPVRRYSI
jgi:NTE family protein